MGSKFNNWKKNEVIKSKRSHNNYFLIPLTKKNKRGWIMILEAFIAIMVLIGFFIATIQRQTPQPDIAANVYKVQQQILWEASDDNAIREDVIVNNQICSLENFVYLRTPSAFDYHVQTCDPPGLCPMNLSASEVKPTGDVFVNDRILSTTLKEYNPTVIQLFFWYGTPHVPNCTITVTPTVLIIQCDKGAGRIITITYPDNVECFSCGRIGVTGTPITGVYLLDAGLNKMTGTDCSSKPCNYPTQIPGCSFSVNW